MIIKYVILNHGNGNTAKIFMERYPDMEVTIPLTLEHEKELLQNAGFSIEKVFANPDGATIMAAGKGRT